MILFSHIFIPVEINSRIGKASTDIEGDWTKLEEYLRRCYRSIHAGLSA